MLKQNIKIDKQDNDKVERSPFLLKFFEKHPYKEYRDEQNRLTIEWKNIKLVQVLRNEEDKQKYIQCLKEYMSYIKNNLDVSEQFNEDVFDYNELFEHETTHHNYDKFPMFFTYEKELIGLCGYHNCEEFVVNNHSYKLQEISCRFQHLVSQNSLEKRRGHIILILFDYAERNNQKIFANIFKKYLDLAFHFTDIIKNFHFYKKIEENVFLKGTNLYSFNNISS